MKVKKVSPYILRAFSVWCRDFNCDSPYFKGSADSMLRLLNDFGFFPAHDEDGRHIHLKKGSEVVATFLNYLA